MPPLTLVTIAVGDNKVVLVFRALKKYFKITFIAGVSFVGKYTGKYTINQDFRKKEEDKVSPSDSIPTFPNLRSLGTVRT